MRLGYSTKVSCIFFSSFRPFALPATMFAALVYGHRFLDEEIGLGVNLTHVVAATTSKRKLPAPGFRTVCFQILLSPLHSLCDITSLIDSFEVIVSLTSAGGRGKTRKSKKKPACTKTCSCMGIYKVLKSGGYTTPALCHRMPEFRQRGVHHRNASWAFLFS